VTIEGEAALDRKKKKTKQFEEEMTIFKKSIPSIY
jgi:hypothetical protein